jgi:hypothetical protein
MTEHEVTAVVGCPPGNYSSPVLWVYHRDSIPFALVPGAVKLTQWTAYDGVINAWFDERGRLVIAEWHAFDFR